MNAALLALGKPGNEQKQENPTHRPREAARHSTRRQSGLTVLAMTKEEIAGILEQIATLLELKGENPFKIRAYTNAAHAIETFGGNIPNFQDQFQESGRASR